MDIAASLALLDGFSKSADLTARLQQLEASLVGVPGHSIPELLKKEKVEAPLLDAAMVVKRAAGQINVVIHALGILLALPHLLEGDEEVLSTSLGAGNTGRAFDLETDRRVAEFKFIAWRGGAEAVRQNSVFIDLLHLLQDQSGRRRFLYVLNKDIPLKFLHGNRAIGSILSRSSAADSLFRSLYGTRYERVSQWYANEVRHEVEIVDLNEVLPNLASAALRKVVHQEP